MPEKLTSPVVIYWLLLAIANLSEDEDVIDLAISILEEANDLRESLIRRMHKRKEIQCPPQPSSAS